MFCVCPFPFGFEGGIRDLIVLIPNHCISIYFEDIFEKAPYMSMKIYVFTIHWVPMSAHNMFTWRNAETNITKLSLSPLLIWSSVDACKTI